MQTLYLLRHGKSSWKNTGGSDFDRPLKRRGREDAARIGALLVAIGALPATILCSKAARARETLECLLAGLGAADRNMPVRIVSELYLAAPATILRLLESIDPAMPSAMVIAHNPGLQDLALDLAGNREDDAWRHIDEKFPTAALACLTAAAPATPLPRAGGWRLDFFLTPKTMIPKTMIKGEVLTPGPMALS